MSGYGKLTLANKTVYCGKWENGDLPYGIVKYFRRGSYQGELKKGQRHGKGEFTHADGDIRNGIWKDGKMHSGEYTFIRQGKTFKYLCQDGNYIWLNP
jgi:hypothetical protein